MVYKVRDLCSDKVLALKASHPCFDQSARIAISKEYVVLSRCNHPKIVEAFHFDIAGEGSVLPPGTLFFTMEYLHGTTLDKVKNICSCNIEEILFQILDALRLIHSIGLIYGDLKPHNIMYMNNRAGNNDIKLFDFGLAMREGHQVNGREISGTISYVAPEMIRGGRIDRRTDLYSLGVMIYELTTGIHPFPKKNVISIAQGHLFDTPLNPINLNPKISEKSKELILRLLRKDPDRRFQSVEEIISFLERMGDRPYGSSFMVVQKKNGEVKEKAGRGEFLKISEKPSPSALTLPASKRENLFSFKN